MGKYLQEHTTKDMHAGKWIMNHAGCQEHTKVLFLKIKTFKYLDIVQFKTEKSCLE